MTDAGLNRDQDRQIDTTLRPVAFRGAGFVASPKAWAGWTALVVVIGFGNWQGAPAGSIRYSCRRPRRS